MGKPMKKENKIEEKTEYERFSVSLPTNLFHEFEEFREKNNLSRSDSIRKAMRDYLDKETKVERISSELNTSAIIVLTLEHTWEGMNHDHDKITFEEHSTDHSEDSLNSIMSSNYFTKPDTDLIKINHIEHFFHDIVITKIHVHLEHDKCKLIIPVKGAGSRIKRFYDRILQLKSIISYNLYM
jgi:metal-responsive CopG/Arc/MetJ family transcriptional regulator